MPCIGEVGFGEGVQEGGDEAQGERSGRWVRMLWWVKRREASRAAPQIPSRVALE